MGMKRPNRSRRSIRRSGRSEPMGLCGMWRFDLYGPDGVLKKTVEKKNLITNNGLDLAVDYLLGANFPTSQGDGISHVMIGSGSTAPSSADTDLQSTLASEPIEEYTAGGVGVGTVSVTFGAGIGTGTVAEAGLANGLTGPVVLFNRVTFSGVAKGAGDTLKVSFSLTISNA